MPHRAGLDQTKVVEEAARLVDYEGVEQLSLKRLAERLGVRSPSLYNHVPGGLSGLQHDLAVYCLRELLDRLMRATIGKSREDAIFAFANAFRSYAQEMPGRYFLTLRAPDPDDQELQAVAGQTLDVVRAVLAPYRLNEQNTIHAIRGLRSIVHGFISLEAREGFRMAVATDESFHWLISMYITGLEQLPSNEPQKKQP